MNVHFTPEQHVAFRAARVNKRLPQPLHYCRGSVAIMHLLAAAEKGIAAAEWGEFIEEEEMDARVKQMFRP